MDTQQTEYDFASLSNAAVTRLRQLETELLRELGEDITLVAYAKRDGNAPEAAACRADLEGQ